MTEAPARPELDAILRHLLWLCEPAYPQFRGLRIEVSWGLPAKGPNRGRTFDIFDVRNAAQFAAQINGSGYNVYVGATLKCANASGDRRTSAADALLATCIPIDIDQRFSEVATRVAALIKPQLLVLTGRAPAPRAQLFARIAPELDLRAWEQLHALIVRHCGGDDNALGRNRLMRLAGTVSFPSPSKIERGYVVEQTSAHFVTAPEYVVADLLARATSLAVRPVPIPRQSFPASTIRTGRRTKPPVSAVEAAAAALPDHYSDEQRLWIKVGFALYDFDPGRIGLDLWRRFSHRCPTKAQMTDFEKLWQRFGRPYSGHRITIDWLMCEARRPCAQTAGGEA